MKPQRMLIGAMFILSIICTYCRSLTVSDCQQLTEKLNAENRLLNKKNVMLSRQNTVIAEENIILKRNLEQKNAQYQKLREDSEALERKLRADIALLEERNKNLIEKNRILAAESSEKIKELTELNKLIEKKLSDEINKLNEALKKQAEVASQEKESLLMRITHIEYESAKKIEEHKKLLNEREAEISDLKSNNAMLSMKISELTKKYEELLRTVDQLENQLKNLRESKREGESNAQIEMKQNVLPIDQKMNFEEKK